MASKQPDFVADYTTMEVGAGVGTGKVLVTCRKCGKPGVRKEHLVTARLTHVVELFAGIDGPSQKASSFCKVPIICHDCKDRVGEEKLKPADDKKWYCEKHFPAKKS